MTIPPEHLKIEPPYPSRPGGQQVGYVSSAIRVTHIPTGIEVTFDGERSQLKNMNKALEYLTFILEYEECLKQRGS